MKKRFAAIILAISILTACFSVTAFAKLDSDYYYGTLSGDAKEIYGILLSNLETVKSGGSVTIEHDMTADEYDDFEQSLNTAAEAFMRDRQELCSREWMWGTSYTWRSNSSVYHYTIELAFSLGREWRYGGRSVTADWAATQHYVSQLAEAARNAGSTRYDQLLYLHNWLAENNVYDQTAARTEAIIAVIPLSALDASLSPVCEGYSRAFMLVCHELDIPCILATGTADGGDHMWNYVQMEDGNWYAVDITFDDPSLVSRYGYVLPYVKSGYETTEYFLVGSTKLLSDHSPDNWTYPTLSAADYDPDNAAAVNTAPETTAPETSLPEESDPETTVVGENKNAAATNDALYVDSVKQSPAIYKIDGNNYFKLRDVAALLNGTSKQFEVTYDTSGTVTVTSGYSYTPVGGELTGTALQTADAIPGNDVVVINGVTPELTIYKIAGNNYIKLRDLGEVLDFYVGYDSVTRSVFIDTSRGYSSDT